MRNDYLFSKVENKKKKLPSYLTESEFLELLKLTKKTHHKLAFILGFNSGLRISEVVSLKPEHIDFEGKRIFIKNSKWGKDRVVPLPKSFPKSYLSHIPIKCGCRALQIAFTSKIKRSSINKTNLSFHSLRHSFAVRSMERGIPLNHIQVLLGHESIKTTSIYLRINPKDALDKYKELW